MFITIIHMHVISDTILSSMSLIASLVKHVIIRFTIIISALNCILLCVQNFDDDDGNTNGYIIIKMLVIIKQAHSCAVTKKIEERIMKKKSDSQDIRARPYQGTCLLGCPIYRGQDPDEI